MAERLPPGVYDTKQIRSMYLPNGITQHGILPADPRRDSQLRNDPNNAPGSPTVSSPSSRYSDNFNMLEERPNTQKNIISGMATSVNRPEDFDRRETERFQINLNGSKPRSPTSAGNQVEAEWIEQYEPGVYITLVALHDGTRELKRVRFRQVGN